MKKLKEPKTFNRPRAYIRVDGIFRISYLHEFRIRIIYPDGKVEWSDSDPTMTPYNDGFFSGYPCWHLNSNNYVTVESNMTARDAVKAMKVYDKCNGFKTLFIGEF